MIKIHKNNVVVTINVQHIFDQKYVDRFTGLVKINILSSGLALDSPIIDAYTVITVNTVIDDWSSNLQWSLLSWPMTDGIIIAIKRLTSKQIKKKTYTDGEFNKCLNESENILLNLFILGNTYTTFFFFFFL
jgi:hypothetical protein